jgi:hypothetical protein
LPALTGFLDHHHGGGMRKILLTLVLAPAIVSPAAAQNMPLPQFLDRATKLEKKGPLALLSRGEIKALQTEMQGANKAVVAEHAAKKKSGAKQAFCPVKGDKYQLGAKELLTQFRAIPAAQARSMTTTDGMRHLLAKRYPCPA